MPVVRRAGGLVAVAVPLLAFTAHPVSHEKRTFASASAAHAQGAAGPTRIDLYLPPARVAPPLPVKPPKRPARPAAPRKRDEGVSTLLDQAAPAVRPARRPRARPAWKPGLYTVSRVGRRLFYRKGFLGQVPVHLVVADLNDPEIKIGVMVAKGGIGTRESFESMVKRARPAAAITGTFFGLRNSLPTGDLVVNGRAIYQGFVGTALAFTEGNIVSFIPTRYKEKPAWQLFDGVMRGGPLLVQEGRIAVGPREEGFRSLSAAARRPRTAVGITPGRKLLLLTVKEPVSLWRLAKLMRELGAFHAVAMDGGSSTGLCFRGQIIARPARKLTNLLVVYAYQDRYEQAKSSFLIRRKPGTAKKPAPAPQPVTAPPTAMTETAEPAVETDPPAAQEPSETPVVEDPAVPLPPPAPTAPPSGPPPAPAGETTPPEERTEKAAPAPSRADKHPGVNRKPETAHGGPPPENGDKKEPEPKKDG
jgi:hypothetical protein